MSSSRVPGLNQATPLTLFDILHMMEQDVSVRSNLWESFLRNEGPMMRNPMNRGISSTDIDRLPCFTYQNANNNSITEPCSICLEPYQEGTRVRALPCMHHYHAECIDTWLQQHDTCPVCKSSAR
jgi:hypothetical protein